MTVLRSSHNKPLTQSEVCKEDDMKKKNKKALGKIKKADLGHYLENKLNETVPETLRRIAKGLNTDNDDARTEWCALHEAANLLDRREVLLDMLYNKMKADRALDAFLNGPLSDLDKRLERLEENVVIKDPYGG